MIANKTIDICIKTVNLYFIFADETFLVGLNVAVSVDIKLKRGSGVIFSVGTPDGEFAVLELRSGEVVLLQM